MITLNLEDKLSADAVIAAYIKAGGHLTKDVSTTVATELPATPKSWGWTRRASDQYPNLYQGLLDLSQVKAMQAPQQEKGWTRLDAIVRALGEHRFASAHVAEQFLRPENLGAFLKVCPKGYLCFLERYRDEGRYLRVVYLYVHEGVVRAGIYYAYDVSSFDADYSFAVSELDAPALSPAPAP